MDKFDKMKFVNWKSHMVLLHALILDLNILLIVCNSFDVEFQSDLAVFLLIILINTYFWSIKKMAW